MAFYLIAPSLCSVISQCQGHFRGFLMLAHSAWICLCILSIECNVLNNKLVQPFKGVSPVNAKNELSWVCNIYTFQSLSFICLEENVPWALGDRYLLQLVAEISVTRPEELLIKLFLCGSSLKTRDSVVNILKLFYTSEGEKGNTLLIRGVFATKTWWRIERWIQCNSPKTLQPRGDGAVGETELGNGSASCLAALPMLCRHADGFYPKY